VKKALKKLLRAQKAKNKPLKLEGEKKERTPGEEWASRPIKKPKQKKQKKGERDRELGKGPHRSI